MSAETRIMRLNPVKSDTVQERVYDEILNGILSGRIRPGEKLTMEGLARTLNVSLTPVRVALQKLEAGGFLNIGRNRRIVVTELTKDSLLEIQDIRLLLECHAAEIACKNRSEEALTKLEKLNRECNSARNEYAYLEANSAFHGVIYSEASMPILEETINSLWQRVSPYLHILFRGTHDWTDESFSSRHRGILEAMQKQDPEAIRYWLAQDLTEAARLIIVRLDELFKR